MSRSMWRTRRGAWVVLLVLLCAAGAAGAEPPRPAAAAAPPESEVWGWWPLLPWDRGAVAAPAWAAVLNQPLDLTRRGRAGEQRRYRIRRTNLTVDRQGAPLSRMTAEAELSRTLVREEATGLWVEHCVWERYAAAQTMGPHQYPTPQELPGARGLAFEFSPRSFDYVNPPVDFSKVGDEMSGYLLKVLTMDAMGWDAVLLALRDELGDAVRIGDTWRRSEWEPWDITRVGEEGLVGRYHVGEMQVSVAGITRVQGEPCVLIWFSMEGNQVTQQVESPQFAMNMRAIEYFRGQLAASLLDGHLVAMELWGPLPCVIEMGFGGQPATEQPVGAIIQQVSMWELRPAQEAGGQ